MNALVVLKIVLVIDLYVSIRDDQKHLVEAKPGKRIGYPFQVTEFDGLPFLHERARRSLRKLLNTRLSEYDGVLLDAVSPDSHFIRFPEDLNYFIQQGQNFDSTEGIINIDDSEIQPGKQIKKKSKKLAIEKLIKKRRTKKKGKKKMHRKRLVHKDNSTSVKGQPFDIVVHIKVNET